METTLTTRSKEQALSRAEETFKKKEKRATEAAKAMAEYNAGLIATREKTARLRAQRLAQEAARLAAAK